MRLILPATKLCACNLFLRAKVCSSRRLVAIWKPAAGFRVIATANTKGEGSIDGRFIGTNVLNEAFLERFALTFEQDYPTPKIEQKILEGISLDLGLEDREFCEKLAQWADIIRKTFNDGGIDEVISTRRLVHIIRAYAIFGKRKIH